MTKNFNDIPKEVNDYWKRVYLLFGFSGIPEEYTWGITENPILMNISGNLILNFY